MGNDRLINFCHPNLCSTVSSNTCCSESYEETNLLSSDPSKFSRGFMADRFIKPPIEIQFNFRYPVNLTSILLWPRVGQQKSSGLEVITQFRNGPSTVSERIGLCYLSDLDEGVVFFCPRKFGRGKLNHDSSSQPNFARRPFSWQKMSAITDVTNVTIKIVRTNSSSVPALAKIEIWGEPGFHSTIHEKKTVWSLWEQCHIKNKQVSIPQPQSPAPGTSRECSLPAKTLDIPEEFLDGLTFEMMSLPMVLPSGKVVDQRTLERHQDSEANWGRPPSDPFTGRPFSATLHPVLDTALKSRIDHFLVLHQDKGELQYVPRTLGRKEKSSYTTRNEVMKLLKEDSVMIKLNKIGSVPCQKHSVPQCKMCFHSSSSSSDNEPDCTSGKSGQNIMTMSDDVKNSENTKSKKRALSPEITIISENVVPTKSLKLEKNRPVSVGMISKSSSSRQQTDDDLDEALTAVLNGLPSFVNVEETPQRKPDNCCNCESRDNLFKLPCEHLVCRSCLLEKSKSAQPSCYLCNLDFTSNQPVKYHPAV